MDSGMFYRIQKNSEALKESDKSGFESMNAIYKDANSYRTTGRKLEL
jgi:hypothetical protein